MRSSFSFLPLYRLLILAGSLLLLCTATGCGGTQSENTEVTIAEALAFETIGWGYQGRVDTTEIAVRDSSTWAAYQDSLRPLRPFQKVNFDQEMVLLAALPVTSGGYNIRFQVVEKTADSLRAHYLLSTPGYDCITTMSASVVFQAVRTVRNDSPVHFIREEETDRCTEPR